jgi:hypothetical protein
LTTDFQDWSHGEGPFEILKSRAGFRVPDELVRLLEKKVECQRLLAKPGDEPANRGNATCESLDIPDAARLLHLEDCINLLWVDLNASL